MARRGWKIFCRLMACALAVGWVHAASAAQTVRVVEYNIEADIDGYTAPRTGLYEVLEATGENYVNGVAHPLDLLALEETTSTADTVTPIVNALNTYYGVTTYATSTSPGERVRQRPFRGQRPQRHGL